MPAQILDNSGGQKNSFFGIYQAVEKCYERNKDKAKMGEKPQFTQRK